MSSTTSKGSTLKTSVAAMASDHGALWEALSDLRKSGKLMTKAQVTALEASNHAALVELRGAGNRRVIVNSRIAYTFIAAGVGRTKADETYTHVCLFAEDDMSKEAVTSREYKGNAVNIGRAYNAGVSDSTWAGWELIGELLVRHGLSWDDEIVRGCVSYVGKGRKIWRDLITADTLDREAILAHIASVKPGPKAGNQGGAGQSREDAAGADKVAVTIPDLASARKIVASMSGMLSALRDRQGEISGSPEIGAELTLLIEALTEIRDTPVTVDAEADAA